ncbi:hypothetical protein SKAU_G00280680 [Synaphobranchus kaupii]|uniref:Uncharacterized protein n=1 Tax=Synaphobranchus kaupii TaxID=118154 RepID=A0A9Q1EX08_SYNKA|nr:hypothetical protein SKAU_G00280680 [Synaphobranchus kaupii]
MSFPREHGGEGEGETAQPAATSRCTEVCDKGKEPRSCSKICLVKVYPKTRPDKATKVYAILDNQSNRSLARSKFFNLFQIRGSDSPYTLRTCAGVTETSGRRATGFMAESLDGSVMLPTLIECNHMPDDRLEIPTPVAAQHHIHLKSIAHRIPLPHLDPEAQILLLQRAPQWSSQRPLCPTTRPWLGCYRRRLLGLSPQASDCHFLPDQCA